MFAWFSWGERIRELEANNYILRQKQVEEYNRCIKSEEKLVIKTNENTRLKTENENLVKEVKRLEQHYIIYT